MLECVLNVSEGRSASALGRLVAAAGPSLLDCHSDPHHHRSVLTMAGSSLEDDVRAVASAAVQVIDLSAHEGAHPRLGALDVVPFVPIGDGSCLEDAAKARDDFATWAGRALAVPCFCYGPDRSLPEVRRRAFRTLAPDTGPAHPHPTAGASAVGARQAMVAYNVWLAEPDPSLARAIAAALRGPALRALGFELGGRAQVSFNLVDPETVGPEAAYDAVASRAAVAAGELVGLLPERVLSRVPRRRWGQLGLAQDKTIEARLRR